MTKKLQTSIILAVITAIAMLIVSSTAAKLALGALFFVVQIIGLSVLGKRKSWQGSEYYALAAIIFNLAFLIAYLALSATPFLVGFGVVVLNLLAVYLVAAKKSAPRIVVYESKPARSASSIDNIEIKKDIEEIKNELQNGNGQTYMAKKTGKKYHRPNCMAIAKADRTELMSFGSKLDAEAKGFRPCKICVD